MMTSPDSVEDLYNASLAYFQARDFERAFESIERAIALYPDRAELYNQLGVLQKHQEQFSLAEASFQKALSLNPRLATSYHHLGLLFQKQYRYAEAEKYYQAALKLEPDFTQAMHNLALVYLSQQRKEQALAAWLGILSAHPSDVRAHFQIGKLLLLEKKPEEANCHFAQAASFASEDVSVLESILRVLMECQEYIFAKKYAEEMARLSKNSPEAQYTLGVILEKLRQTDSAINAYRRALECDQNFFAAWNNLGVLYLERELTDRARDCFEKAHALAPENENIRYTLSALKGDADLTKSPQGYITQLFDHYAEHFDVHLREGLQYQVPELLFTLCQPYLPKTSDWHLLDLGCGTGLAALAFKPYCEYVVGVDLSSKMLDKAGQKNLYDKLICGEISQVLKNTQEMFDLVLAADVLVYQGQLETWFLEITQRLKSGGLFAFSVELTESAPFKLQKSGRFAHAQSYLQSLAKKSGFEILRAESAVTRVQNHRSVYGGVIVLRKR